MWEKKPLQPVGVRSMRAALTADAGLIQVNAQRLAAHGSVKACEMWAE